MWTIRRCNTSWVVAIIAILGVLVWQALSVAELFNSYKERYITRVERKMEHAVNRLNVLAARKTAAISWEYDAQRVSILEEGITKTCEIQDDEDIITPEYCAMYDVRDTSRWKLEELYTFFRKRIKVKRDEFSLVISITDSVGNEIDRLEKGDINPWLLMEATPIRLGIVENHALNMEICFPLHHFLNRSEDAFIILTLLFLLLVTCVVCLLRERRREKMRLIGQHSFIEAVIHNFKSPLDSMFMFHDTINRNYLSIMKPEHQNLWKGDKEMLQNMSKTILRLSTMSNIFRKIPFSPNELNLMEMFQKLTRLNYVLIPEGKKVEIHVPQEMENPFISADTVLLPAVFGNLIGNAIKYSGANVNIDITCHERGEKVVIQVKDNGIGIPPKSLKHIFDIYYRAPSVREEQTSKGFGLGLTFVRSVVKSHGGRITVNSVVNEGTEFIIILPRKQWKRK